MTVPHSGNIPISQFQCLPFQARTGGPNSGLPTETCFTQTPVHLAKKASPTRLAETTRDVAPRETSVNNNGLCIETRKN